MQEVKQVRVKKMDGETWSTQLLCSLQGELEMRFLLSVLICVNSNMLANVKLKG